MKNIAKILCFVISLVLVFSVIGISTFAEETAVATVNGVEYTSLADAIAAVGAGDVVIELVADTTFNYGARMAYGTAETTSLTIDGNGHTLSLYQTDSDWGSIGLLNPDAKLVFNDVVIEKIGYGDTNGAWNTHALNITAILEMNGVTVNQALCVQNDAVLKNVVINEANGYYGLWITAEGQSVTYEGGSITATNGGRGVKIADQYTDGETVVLNISDVAFNTASKAAILVSSVGGANIVASNLDISNVAEDSTNIAWVDEEWSDCYGLVTVNGDPVGIEGGFDAYPVFAEVDGVNGYYLTLNAALNAGENIKLLADVVADGAATIAAGKTVVLNLNGYTISYFSDIIGEGMITNSGNLTITGDGKISYAYTGTPDSSYGQGNYTLVNLGTLTIESGVIENNTAKMSHAFYAIDNRQSAQLTVNGGTVSCLASDAIRLFYVNGGITVNGGKISGYRAILVQQNANSTYININDGEFNKSNTNDANPVIYVYSYGPRGAVNVNVTGGTFNGNIVLGGGSSYDSTSSENVVVTGGTFNGQEGIITFIADEIAVPAISIKGGLFTTDACAVYAEDDGFKFIKNIDGKYGVIAVSATPEIIDGYWYIGGVNTGMIAEPTVEIKYNEYDDEYYWYVNGECTYIQAIGDDGVAPEIAIVNGYWYIDNNDGKGLQPTGVKAEGVDGITIKNIVLDSQEGNVDIYKITFAHPDGSESYSYFTVTNGIQGAQGAPGVQGPEGPKGDKGDQGATGSDGNDNNKTVVIVIAVATVCIIFALSIVLYRGVKRRSWWCTT